jgi:hypothetical protein
MSDVKSLHLLKSLSSVERKEHLLEQSLVSSDQFFHAMERNEFLCFWPRKMHIDEPISRLNYQVQLWEVPHIQSEFLS